TAVCLSSVRVELEGRQDLREEEPVAQAPTDEIGVFADEPHAGSLRQVAFENWAGVHIPQRACAGIAQLVDELRERCQPLAQHVMVLGVARITGYFGHARWQPALICQRTPGRIATPTRG